MHFYKKTTIGKSNNYIKLVIKLTLAAFRYEKVDSISRVYLKKKNKSATKRKDNRKNE